MQQWHVLRVGAGDRVDGAQLPHAEGRADHAESPKAGVAVGGIPRAQLVGHADPLDSVIVIDMIEEG